MSPLWVNFRRYNWISDNGETDLFEVRLSLVGQLSLVTQVAHTTIKIMDYYVYCSRKIFRIPSRNARKIDIYNQTTPRFVIAWMRYCSSQRLFAVYDRPIRAVQIFAIKSQKSPNRPMPDGVCISKSWPSSIPFVNTLGSSKVMHWRSLKSRRAAVYPAYIS